MRGQLGANHRESLSYTFFCVRGSTHGGGGRCFALVIRPDVSLIEGLAAEVDATWCDGMLCRSFNDCDESKLLYVSSFFRGSGVITCVRQCSESVTYQRLYTDAFCLLLLHLHSIFSYRSLIVLYTADIKHVYPLHRLLVLL